LQPSLNAEQQYQLARKIVGAEMQIVTYREFLPALMGPMAPRAEQYVYSTSAGRDPSVTNSFAHAAYRFGHSTLSPNLKLAEEGGSETSLPLRHAFFNPGVISDDPAAIDRLLLGAARQASQEVDLKVVDDVRNFLFGPPGAGGLDLAALNIQRGRDHGLPHYNSLRSSYSVPFLFNFDDMPTDAATLAALEEVYEGNLNNIDPWIGGLAESHVPGASVGPMIGAILVNQFTRTRDGDRLFYLSDAAGLYANKTLNPEVEAIIDLDAVRLSDVIEWNTSLTGLPENLFFVMMGDFDGDGVVDGGDLAEWGAGYGGDNSAGDADGDGRADGADFLMWQRQVGMGAPAPQSASVPEPALSVLAWCASLVICGRRPVRR
jgi:hypothetical protein